jgi:NAD(P)-dependent dehydrogenase (short-subunit alcohol dehydrogenase family)
MESSELVRFVYDITDAYNYAHRKLAKEIEAREKCLCILVNNAGIAPEKTRPEGKDAEEVKKNLFDPATCVFYSPPTTPATSITR